MEATALLSLASKHPEIFGAVVIAVLFIIIGQLRGIRKDLNTMVTRPECELHRKLLKEESKNLILEQKNRGDNGKA